MRMNEDLCKMFTKEAIRFRSNQIQSLQFFGRKRALKQQNSGFVYNYHHFKASNAPNNRFYTQTFKWREIPKKKTLILERLADLWEATCNFATKPKKTQKKKSAHTTSWWALENQRIAYSSTIWNIKYIEMWCASVVCTDSVCTNRIGWGLSAQNSVTNTNRHHSHTIYLTHDLRSAHHLTTGETVRLLLQWILSNIFPFGFFLCFVYCCWRFFFARPRAYTHMWIYFK